MSHLLLRSLPLLVAAPWCAALSSERVGNVFSLDEPEFVLVTSLANGSSAAWSVLDDYGASVTGNATVTGGRIRVPSLGLRSGRCTFSVTGDGSLAGGVVQPPLAIHPDFASYSLQAPFNLASPAHNLLWRQLGIRELRMEGAPDGSAALDAYCSEAQRQGVRVAWKIDVARQTDYPAYRARLATFAARYLPLGMDHFYEVNEPDGSGFLWKGTAEQYAEHQDSTHAALKSVDARIIHIGPEMYSLQRGFLATALGRGSLDALSAHYPSDDQTGDALIDFHFSEMRAQGRWLPAMNGEDQCWQQNWNMAGYAKFYPGVGGNCTGHAPGASQLVNRDLGMHRVVHLLETWNGNYRPFTSFDDPGASPGVPTLVNESAFQLRAVSDHLAGAAFRGRIPGAPLHVLGWLYRRAGTNFIAAYVPEGDGTQLMRIATSRTLSVVDCFGNAYPATPAGGVVDVLLANTEIFVHGLGDDDAVSFVPRTANLPPELSDPGPQQAIAGRPFRLQLAGRDPEMRITNYGRRVPSFSLVSAPSGMSVHGATGLLSWTPSTAGSANVRARISDGDGGTAEREFAITVQAAGGNIAPRILGRPAPVALVGATWRYPLVAVDDDGDAITWSLGEHPAGMTLVGSELRWSPVHAGVVTCTVTAVDARGASSAQTCSIEAAFSPDRPGDGMAPPRTPTSLTVTGVADGTTMVWNPHSPGSTLVQRAPAATGPWTTVAATTATCFRDPPRGSPTWYRVVARNSGGLSDPSPAVRAGNRAPIANAGGSVRLAAPGTAAINGSASADLDGDAITCRWTVVNAPTGASTTFASATSASTSITVSAAGRYCLRLTVSDGVETSWDDIRLLVGEAANNRSGDAGPQQRLASGQTLSLTGSASAASSAANDHWFWRWHELPLGGYADIPDRRGSRTITCTPRLPGVYRIMMVPIDDWLNGYPELQTTVVMPTSAHDATALAVDAGPDSAVLVGSAATLAGLVTVDGICGAITATWNLVSGPAAPVFADAAQAETTATFPAAGTYVLRLAAGAGSLAATDTVTITVSTAGSAPPRIRSPPPLHAIAGTPWTHAPAADIPGGGAATWSLPEAPAGVTIQAVTGVLQWSSPATAGSHVRLRLRVATAAGSDEQTLTILVLAAGASG